MNYAKTAFGQQALKDRSVALSPRQRSAFILFDGKRSTTDVLAATQGLGVTAEDIEHLLALGLLAATEAEPAVAPAPPPVGVPTAPTAVAPAVPLAAGMAEPPGADRYRLAYPMATQLTSSLGLRGYRLTLAVETAGSHRELLELLPRLQEALGAEKCRELERILKG